MKYMQLVVLALISLKVLATAPFVRVEGGLAAKAGGAAPSSIPFDPSWAKGMDVRNSESAADSFENLPSHLTVPDFVEVYEYNDKTTTEGNSCDVPETDQLKQIGKAAREVVDASKSDVVLFRNLSSRIHNAKEFASFFEGCLEGPNGWQPMTYVPFRNGRATLDGVDLVTPFPPQRALPAHNEMSYNPQPAGRIAFFCLQNADEGGETILTRNADLTDAVSSDLQRFVQDHGGIVYRREYLDGTKADTSKQGEVAAGTGMPNWQEKTGRNDRDEARKFFIDLGFSPEEVYFDERGTLIVRNIHSGFIDAPDGIKKYWFNVLYLGVFNLADGSSIPPAMLTQLKNDEWKAAYALKLRPGDWIVLNNRVVQHGRLPFVDSPEKKRTILTVYTD